MSLQPGIRLGPYEILSAIGAGGMGEVYKAKDTRLDRFVAVKVLPEHLAKHPESLARFEREAKAVAALNHPNILGIHDFASHDGTAYVAMELLEGESLRDRLEKGPLAPRKATELAIQLAQGLAAAHEKGVIHRDLKPENLWITKDGRLKILDFGLAKRAAGPRHVSQSFLETGVMAPDPAFHTQDGMVFGTLGYMSPEQLRGESVDARSDIFAFGAVLFEMLSGRMAFARNSAADTMAAILKEDPPDFDNTGGSRPSGLQRVLQHCLEKEPGHRFQDAQDLAFALEGALGAPADSAMNPAPGSVPSPMRRPRQLAAGLFILGAAATMLILAGSGFLTGPMSGGSPNPTIKRLTFQRGTVESARFAPDGKTIVYSARWLGKPPALFALQTGSPEARPLGFENASLLGISSTQELALQLASRTFAGLPVGKLARVPLNGGGLRDLKESIAGADWNAAGELVILYPDQRFWKVECPPGRVHHETTNFLEFPRAARRGRAIAFFEGGTSANWLLHPEPGRILLVEPGNEIRVLAEGVACTGLAWSPDGSELWFSECAEGSQSRLWGLSLKGRRRLIWSSTGNLALEDVSADGRALMALRNFQKCVLVLAPGAELDRDLSIYDDSEATDFTRDGRLLLINERGSGARGKSQVFMRGLDGSAPVNLGEGSSSEFSADASLVLAAASNRKDLIRLIPTGTGSARDLPLPGLSDIAFLSFLPDGRRLIIRGGVGGKPNRHHLLDLESGTLKPITPEATGEWQGQKLLSPDGMRIATTRDSGADTQNLTFPLEGGEPTPVKGLGAREIPIRWTPDGRGYFVFNRGGLPVRIQRFDHASGNRQLVREFIPSDPGGVAGAQSVTMTPDGKTIAFNVRRSLSDLYLIEGLK